MRRLSAGDLEVAVTGQDPIAFFVAGIPQTKGSLRAFMPRGARRPVLTNDNPKNKLWAREVSAAATDAMGGRPPLAGPVQVVFRFSLPRPKSHFRKSGALKDGAPVVPTTRPDWDKVARSVSDALSKIVYGDDAQVAAAAVFKVYGERPGVAVVVSAVTGPVVAAETWAPL